MALMILLATLASACLSTSDAPGRQLNVVGPAWHIVDPERTSREAGTLTFVDSLVVEVATGCGETIAEYALDTDGAALSICAFSRVRDRPCSSEEMERERELLDALATVEEWRIFATNLIAFYDPGGGELLRLEHG